MPRSRAPRLVLGAVALAALLSGCQTNPCLDSSTMMCSPILPTPTPRSGPDPLSQGAGPLARDGVATVIVNVRSAGSLSAVVDWTFASNTVEIYVARGACTATAFLDGRCDVVAASTNPAVKPKRIVVTADSAAVYVLLVRNLGPGDESFAFDIALAR